VSAQAEASAVPQAEAPALAQTETPGLPESLKPDVVHLHGKPSHQPPSNGRIGSLCLRSKGEADASYGLQKKPGRSCGRISSVYQWRLPIEPVLLKEYNVALWILLPLSPIFSRPVISRRPSRHWSRASTVVSSTRPSSG